MEHLNQIEINDEVQEQGPTTSERTAKTKRTDPIWQYYQIDSKKREWYCKLCKRPRIFKYTTECPSATSAKDHRKSSHAKEFASLEKECSGNAEIKKPKKQPGAYPNKHHLP